MIRKFSQGLLKEAHIPSDYSEVHDIKFLVDEFIDDNNLIEIGSFTQYFNYLDEGSTNKYYYLDEQYSNNIGYTIKIDIYTSTDLEKMSYKNIIRRFRDKSSYIDQIRKLQTDLKNLKLRLISMGYEAELKGPERFIDKKVTHRSIEIKIKN